MLLLLQRKKKKQLKNTNESSAYYSDRCITFTYCKIVIHNKISFSPSQIMPLYIYSQPYQITVTAVGKQKKALILRKYYWLHNTRRITLIVKSWLTIISRYFSPSNWPLLLDYSARLVLMQILQAKKKKKKPDTSPDRNFINHAAALKTDAYVNTAGLSSIHRAKSKY